MTCEKYTIPLKDGSDGIFRSPVPEDAKELLEYIIKARQETQFIGPVEDLANNTVEDEIQFIDKHNNNPRGYMQVCEIDGKIVGSFTGKKKSSLWQGHVGSFGIALLEKYWDRGIGTEFIRYFKEWAKDNDVEIIRIRMVEGNARARALYEKMGLRIVRYTPDYLKFPDGEYAGMYELELDLREFKKVREPKWK